MKRAALALLLGGVASLAVAAWIDAHRDPERVGWPGQEFAVRSRSVNYGKGASDRVYQFFAARDAQPVLEVAAHDDLFGSPPTMIRADIDSDGSEDLFIDADRQWTYVTYRAGRGLVETPLPSDLHMPLVANLIIAGPARPAAVGAVTILLGLALGVFALGRARGREFDATA